MILLLLQLGCSGGSPEGADILVRTDRKRRIPPCRARQASVARACPSGDDPLDMSSTAGAGRLRDLGGEWLLPERVSEFEFVNVVALIAGNLFVRLVSP
jgi:hypothetical protein